jgi:hypothetical protein
MKTNYLFPNRFKKIGWLLFIPGIILGIVFLIYESDISLFNISVFAIAEEEILSDATYFSILRNNVLDEITSLLLIIGALLIAFSKEKSEDEFISKIRLESLVVSLRPGTYCSDRFASVSCAQKTDAKRIQIFRTDQTSARLGVNGKRVLFE